MTNGERETKAKELAQSEGRSWTSLSGDERCTYGDRATAPKIEMLNDDGEVTETIEHVHVCVGDSGECEAPAICEDDGQPATPENPVYVWTCEGGMTFFACGRHLATDDFARLTN
jgi:hypothetical protein